MFGHAGPTPEFVMRTGAYALLNPVDARRDVSAQFVSNWTAQAVGRQPVMAANVRNLPPPVATGPILPPQPAAPTVTPPAAPAVAASTMAGFFGLGFGSNAAAPASAPVPAAAPPAKSGFRLVGMDLRSTAIVSGASLGLGMFSGLLAGGPSRRFRGGLIGALSGVATGIAAVWLSRR